MSLVPMAAECSEEAILHFLKDRGGRVKNADFIEHFQFVFPEEPKQKAAVRHLFKQYVDNVAFVKAESGVKYICLKKKFCREPAASHSRQVSDDAQMTPKTSPGSGSGSDSHVALPHHFSAAHVLPDKGEMGNADSLLKEKRVSKEQAGRRHDLPEISVIEVSPLPAQGCVFTLPGPVQTGSTGQVDAAPAGLSPTYSHAETEEEQHRVVTRRRSRKGSQGHAEAEVQCDTHSLSGSEGNITPKCSRTHFIQVMMNSSPQVRRSMVLPVSVPRSENDSDSLVSSNLDTLDPLEHEWMMCASDGEWGKLHRLLATEPSLVLRKDFVTGFTCLHWAAKHGKPELIALIVNFAKQHNIPISVDVRSNTGYTPLHIAAMHNHMEVVKLLVGAYNADVEIRDYSGRKACQYLTDSVSADIRDIIGAYEQSDSENRGHKDGGRWRFSRLLQANLKPLRLLGQNDCDSVDSEDQPIEKPLRRKSSLSRMKPKLEKLRWRTSQIVHSMSFHDAEELNN